MHLKNFLLVLVKSIPAVTFSSTSLSKIIFLEHLGQYKLQILAQQVNVV